MRDFLALVTGEARTDDGDVAPLWLHDVGLVEVPTGRLAFIDAIGMWHAFVVAVPPGTYRVVVTAASLRTGGRVDGIVAYLSVLPEAMAPEAARLADLAAPARPARRGDGDDYWEPEDEAEVGVDTALLVLDEGELAGVRRALAALPGDGEEVRIGWMDDCHDGELSGSVALVDAPGAAARVPVVLPGWGAGGYPVWAARDAAGGFAGIHLDCGIIDRALDPGDGSGRPLANPVERPPGLAHALREAGEFPGSH